MKQGELSGVLKELGYTEDQASNRATQRATISFNFFSSGIQILSSGYQVDTV
jgi:hypothetical protein